MQTISYPKPGERPYVIGPYKEPLARVNPNETITIETLDAFENKIDSQNVDLSKIITLPYINPLTGPIYIIGAEKGDSIAVKIHEITNTRDYGVSCVIPQFGGLCGTTFTRTLNHDLEQRILLHHINEDGINFSNDLEIPRIPYKPFYGTIGTSPEIEAISSLSPGFHGGNMDAADICPGNIVYLPVNIEGALLYIGDGHAAQGDAEVSGVAVEIPTRGTITIELIKNKFIGTPRVESEEYIMTIGSARPMEDAARIAFHELVNWLEIEFGIEKILAYQLCSQVAKVRVANMVDVLYSIVAKFPKKYLPKPKMINGTWLREYGSA